MSAASKTGAAAQAPAYLPRAGSLTYRVCEHFSQQPDETLTVEDIAIKFDAVQASVRTQLVGAVEAGLLASDRNAMREWVYSAGESLSAFRPLAANDTQAQSKPGTATPAPAGKKTRRMVLVDLSGLTIESDIPLPPRNTNPTSKQRFTPAVEKLKAMQPRDSMLMPVGFPPRAVKTITDRAKREGCTHTFEYRLVGEQVRIWRTA